MKKIFTLLFLLPLTLAFGQLEGTTWLLSQQAGALVVGSADWSNIWWQNNAGDLTTRACLFDDSVVFSANGDFANGMGSETWLEPWQGMDPEGCGAPVAPHSDATGTWAYDASTGDLTLTGQGAHIGLPKVINGSEISDPSTAPAEIIYNVTFSPDGNTMTAQVNVGANAWKFVYQKSGTAGGPQLNDVTFLLDMTDYAGTFTDVFISGTFNGWSQWDNALVALGDGTYKITLPLESGNIQYKYQLDGWAAQEDLTMAGACTVSDGTNTNRFLDITESTLLPMVCYESCEACEGGQGSPSDITFMVDMSQYTEDFATVFVSGTFNDWSQWDYPLTDMGNGMWSGTYAIATGDMIEYKFQLNGWEAQEDLVNAGPCTVTVGDNTNRALTIEAGGMALPNVCWESCDICPTSSIEEETSSFVVSPNPFNSNVNISSNHWIEGIQIIDLSGKTVKSFTTESKMITLELNDLMNGVYTLKITSNDSVSTKRIIKN